MVTVDDRSFKEKVKGAFREAKVKAGEAWDNTKTFVKENKGELLFLTMILGPGLLKMGDTMIRRHQNDRDRRRDECDIYDPRTGEHWYTRRPLTSNQQLNLERRYNNGESKGTILKSMHML